MKLIWKFFIGMLSLIFLIFIFSISNFSNEQENFPEDGVYVFPPFPEVYKFRKADFDAAEISGKIDKYFFDKKLRNKLFDSANMMTEPDKNPEVRVIQEIDKGKYLEQKLSLIIFPATISYAYMLIPKNISYPAPLILAMHPHGGFYEYGSEAVVGNKGDKEWAYGKELAERGYVVLAMDAPLFGNRGIIERAGNSNEVFEEFAEQNLLILGHSLLGEVLREDISTLNFLSSLESIDKNRIGCIGHSFGGIRCMYLSALDERVKAVVLANSVADLRRHNRESAPTVHTWFSFIPGSGRYTDTNGILALIAPNPLMIISSEKDPIFPLKEAQKQTEVINKLYERLKYKDNFNFIIELNEAHTFPQKYREEAYNFFDKNLK